MKQLILLALVIVCGVVVLRLAAGGQKSAGTAEQDAVWATISPADAKARMDSGDALTVLDVRTAEEFAGGHVPGAVCLPVEDITADSAAEVLPDKGGEVLVYCRSGRRSAQAAEMLAGLGYTNVSDFGGILDWPYETATD